MTSEVDFEALGISNPPSWTVLLPDDVDGTKLVQVPQAPEVEGLPLSPNLEVIASFWIAMLSYSTEV
jgi:serine/threonine-protein phosphatase 5